jgi:cobaltochelatase CobS
MSHITCMICGKDIHSVQLHLKSDHPDTTLDQYQNLYPGAPILSEKAHQMIVEKRKKAKQQEGEGVIKKALHEVFGLGSSSVAMNAQGNPIMINTFDKKGDFVEFVPDVDDNYVFDVNLLRTIMLGIDCNIPTYLWGHAGVGKSTVIEQICARTGRRYLRIQHTENTEEAHILGQTLANEKGTYFEPGPLAIAMRYGFLYLADEYDFAHPSILGVYQPVLEGKPLVIKEAPPEWRAVRPHPNFRFVATGNTNGSGDESGLYQGTKLGNAANYSRFGVTERVEYMRRDLEISVVSAQGGVDEDDAGQLVDFARLVREAFDAGKMSATVGPRELIYAAKVGARKNDFRAGVMLAFINRLSTVDREVATGFMDRTVESAITS